MGNSCGISEDQEFYDYQTSHASIQRSHHNRHSKRKNNSKYTESDFQDFEEYDSKPYF